MANEYDYESGSGSGFMMGLLTGTVLGAGLGMLFAPKAGSELRGQLTDTASKVGNAASESYHKVAERAGDLKDKGREMGRDVVGRAKDAVSRGAEEARRYSSEAQQRASSSSSSSPGSTTSPDSPYSTGPNRS
jgi:gas vesicle protein